MVKCERTWLLSCCLFLNTLPPLPNRVRHTGENEWVALKTLFFKSTSYSMTSWKSYVSMCVCVCVHVCVYVRACVYV